MALPTLVYCFDYKNAMDPLIRQINNDLNNINTIKHFADHLAKMNKTLVFILLGLVTMVLSGKLKLNQLSIMITL